MRFFERLGRPVAPEGPLEGALKVLLLSQAITAPMTMSSDFADPKKTIGVSMTITMIHLAAVMIGFSWGLINCCRHDADRQEMHL